MSDSKEPTDQATITIRREQRVQLPSLPNFIRDADDKAISIVDLSEEQLREIGKQWTDALVRKAASKRHQMTRAINTKLHGKDWIR
jgi:hypothetical protein